MLRNRSYSVPRWLSPMLALVLGLIVFGAFLVAAIIGQPVRATEISKQGIVGVSATVLPPENPIIAYCINSDGSYSGKSVPIAIRSYESVIGHADYYCPDGWWATSPDGARYLDKSYLPLFWTEGDDGALTPVFVLKY